MTRITFHGELEAASTATITDVLRTWLGSDAVRFRLVREGWSAVHEDAHGYVYFQEHSDNDVSSNYLMEGYLYGARAEAGLRLQALASAFVARGLQVRLDYVEVDDAGVEQGDETSLP